MGFLCQRILTVRDFLILDKSIEILNRYGVGSDLKGGFDLPIRITNLDYEFGDRDLRSEGKRENGNEDIFHL